MRLKASTGRWCACALSAMQIGQARSQWSVTSTMGTQVCCSWSVHSPQSSGQPLSGRVASLSGWLPARE